MTETKHACVSDPFGCIARVDEDFAEAEDEPACTNYQPTGYLSESWCLSCGQEHRDLLTKAPVAPRLLTSAQERALWWHAAWTRIANQYAREAARWLMHEDDTDFDDDPVIAEASRSASIMQAEISAKRFEYCDARANAAWQRSLVSTVAAHEVSDA